MVEHFVHVEGAGVRFPVGPFNYLILIIFMPAPLRDIPLQMQE